MNFLKNNKWLSFAGRLIVGFFFFYAAYGKILDPQQFAHEISNYNIMFDQTINIMALVLPWIEIIIAVFLILGIRIKASAGLTAALLLIFIVAISLAMAQGLNINCGCISGADIKVSWIKLLEDIGLFICSAYVFIYPIKKFTIENILKREL